MNTNAITAETPALDSVVLDDDAHRDAELARLAETRPVANPRRTRR